MIKRNLLVMGLAVLLSACGFQLRGTGTTELAIKELDLSARNAYGETVRQLRQVLESSGVKVSTGAPYKLILTDEQDSQRILSYAGAGRTGTDTEGAGAGRAGTGTEGAGGSGGGTRAGTLRGVYSGGTLCAEARLIAGTGEFTDFGDDAYTRGRAHPMIDPALRLEALAEVPPGDVVLLDVVLGHGADPDPSARLAPGIAAAVARGVPVVVALVGSEGDPQGLNAQAEAVRAAGAAVFTSNAQAARHAAGLLASAR